MALTLPNETAQGVSDKWFTALLAQAGYEEEVAALKAWHDHQCTVEEAAYAITRPITNDPIPEDPHSYNPESKRVQHLFAIFVGALVEWPPCRTADIIALLLAISQLPDQVHRGALDANSGEPMPWAELPCFGWIWGDYAWEVPGAIDARTFASDKEREDEVKRYIWTQDIYAQLTAASLFPIQYAYNYLIGALERDPASNSYIGHVKKVVPEMHVPGCHRWIKACGKRLYAGAVRKEMQTWNSDNEPTMMLNYNHMSVRRWAFWIKRFDDFANSGDEYSEAVKAEAEAAIQHMKNVEEACKAEANA